MAFADVRSPKPGSTDKTCLSKKGKAFAKFGEAGGASVLVECETDGWFFERV